VNCRGVFRTYERMSGFWSNTCAGREIPIDECCSKQAKNWRFGVKVSFEQGKPQRVSPDEN
jgi:hypothetical protein